MGGRIWVETQTGVGSTFHFTITTRAAESERAITVPAGEPDGKPVVQGDGRDAEMGTRLPVRILLAEDNMVNQMVALRLLKRLGYRADVAANGLEVLEALDRQAYDVVLMDVQMPEMDGLEATRRIVADERPRPRIIALTANVMTGDRERYLEAGMDDYISKPIRMPELVEALQQSQALGRPTPGSRRPRRLKQGMSPPK